MNHGEIGLESGKDFGKKLFLLCLRNALKRRVVKLHLERRRVETVNRKGTAGRKVKKRVITHRLADHIVRIYARNDEGFANVIHGVAGIKTRILQALRQNIVCGQLTQIKVISVRTDTACGTVKAQLKLSSGEGRIPVLIKQNNRQNQSAHTYNGKCNQRFAPERKGFLCTGHGDVLLRYRLHRGGFLSFLLAHYAFTSPFLSEPARFISSANAATNQMPRPRKIPSATPRISFFLLAERKFKRSPCAAVASAYFV